MKWNLMKWNEMKNKLVRMQAYKSVATTEKMANHIPTTRQRDKGMAITEFVLGVLWFQKQIYEANILQNSF